MTNKERGERILAWLKDHPLLSISALCSKVDYDQPNLDSAFDKSRAIPAKYLDKFEEELGKYGYEKR